MYPTRHPFLKDLISIILCIAMLFTLLTPTDLTVYAAEEEADEVTVPYREEREIPEPTYIQNQSLLDETVSSRENPEEGDGPLRINDEKYEAAIVSEDSERKDQYTKDFLLEDTTRLHVVYPDAVHYEKDGKWADIDNSLDLTVDEKSGKEVYRNKANCVDIKLPAELSAEDGPEVSYGDDSLRFALIGVTGETEEKQAAEQEEPAKSEEANTTVEEETETAQSAETDYETEEISTEEVATEEESVHDTEETELPDTEEEAPALEEPESTDAEEAPVEPEEESEPEEETESIETELLEETPEETETEEAALQTEASAETEEPEETELTAEPETESVTKSETEPETERETEPEAAAPARTLIPITPVSARINNDPISKEELAAMTERQQRILPVKIHSEAVYQDVLPGIDVTYDLNSTRLKETIVLKEAPEEERSFVFRINSDSLELVLKEDHSIAAVNAAGKEIFTIPTPYCYDAAEEYSHDMVVSLKKTEEGYELIITPDQTWLTDPERVYPVSIDPTVLTTQIRQNIKDMTVASNGGTNYNDDFLEAGYHLTRGIERVYIMFEEIPELSAADVVVDADLLLYRGTTASTGMQVNAHMVNATWTSSTLTWSNKPAYTSTITDYAIASSSGWYDWSITEIAKGWYEDTGKNTGLMLKAPDSVESAGAKNNRTFYSSDHATTSKRPILTLSYVNNCGYESYWDYDSYDLGRAGTAMVNLFTGNMMIRRTDIGFAGNRLPVSITFTYNTNDKRNLNSGGTVITGGFFGVGNGWRTNYHQRVYQYVPEEGTNTGNYTYYIWEDEDGTRHYFKGSSATGTFTDESGVELTLTNTGSGDTTYVITDKGGNRNCFDASGRLRQIKNNHSTGSTIYITHKTSGNTNRIYTITDGAGRAYLFVYDTDTGLLTSIRYKGTGSTILSRVNYTLDTAGALSEVEYEDGFKAIYANAATGNITSVKHRNTGGSDQTLAAFSFTTTSNTLPNKLSSITLTDPSGSGATSTSSYTYRHGYTLAKDMNNKALEYQFNRYGNTVSVQDGKGRALYAKYATDTNSNAKKNQMVLSSKLQSVTNNLFKNPSFERNEYWYSAVNGGGTGTVGYTSTQHYLGDDCFKLTKTNADGYSWVYAGDGNGITLKANTTYTFSAYLKIENLGEGDGVYLTGSVNGTPTRYITYEDTDGWQRAEITLTTPSTVSECLFNVCLFSPGTVYVDCMQLEENALSSRFNLVENSDFTYYTGTTADALCWSEGSGCESAEKRMTLSSGAIGAPNTDKNVYQMTGNTSKVKRVYQDIAVSGSSGDAFSFGGWARGNAAPVKGSPYANDNLFAVVLRFNNTDDTTTEVRADFNTDLYESTTWQYACARAVATKAYSSIRILVVYEKNINTVYYDAIQLFKDEFGSSYTYDSNGNVTSVTDSRNRSNTYEFTSNNMTQATLHDGAVYSYTYDSYHNVKTAVSATGVKSTFSYDGQGNNTLVKVVNPNNSSAAVIQASATYDNSGNTLASVTDSINNTVTYNYNNETGKLTSLTGGGSTTSCTYDSIYRQTGATRSYETGTAKVVYAYDNEHLTGITYGNSTSLAYSLTYGTFDQLSQVKAGGTTLVTNSYTYNSSTNPYYDLSSSVYGNGGRVDYTYDSNGSLVSKKYDSNNNHVVTYTYDNEGKVGKIYDKAHGITHRYTYDISGRLVSYKESGTDRDYRTNIGYDANDNVSTVKEQIGEYLYTNTYTYDLDNRPVKAKTSTTSDNFTYDVYGRVSTETIKLNSNAAVSTAITYYSPAAGKTSLLPATYTNTLNGSTLGYTYAYDTNGYIASITDNANKHTYYKYDKLGQLIREDDEAAGNTWVFNYDNRGNITSKVKYAYTTATTPGTALQTINYTYQSSGFKDILTGVGGTTYTNDTIGNRTGDGTWTYTWEHGRQLASMSKTGTSINYGYGADGQRITKAVTTGGTTTTYDYFYSDGKLIHISWNESDRVHIFYNANGSPISILYNGTRYYYVRNVQGDIVGITTASGLLRVAYTYDAWGKLLTTTGSMAGTLGQVNPLRYRGYVYDTETGLYYLGSRYYDPEVERFINAEPNVDQGEFDENAGILGFNIFCYCANNPVLFTDDDGDSILLCILIGAGIGLLAGGGYGAYAASKKGYSPSDGWRFWKYVVGYGVVGGTAGALIGWGAGVLIAKYGVATAATSITKGGGARFASFRALKQSLGSAGAGKEWHHIVEQCQIQKSGFSKYWIQNSNNVINISKSVHKKISAYYNSIKPFTEGMIFRNWLAGKSFEEQYRWGIKVLKMYEGKR